MLEFLWSGSNKPARADTSAAPGEPVQPPDPTPDAEVVAPSVEPSQGGPEPELSAPSPQAELSDPGTPPAVERSLEEEVRRAAASGEDLPSAFGLARRTGRRPGRRLVKPAEPGRALTAQQRLLLLDTWRRSGLPAGDFAALIGLSKHTLYAWKKKFDQQGPAGLLDQPRGGAGDGTWSSRPGRGRRSRPSSAWCCSIPGGGARCRRRTSQPWSGCPSTRSMRGRRGSTRRDRPGSWIGSAVHRAAASSPS